MRRSRSTARLPSLLAVAAAGCSPGEADAPVRSSARFTLLPSSVTGVPFVNAVTQNPTMNVFAYEYYFNGGGVAAGDLNEDGLPDLYFTANLGPNRLYLNRGGIRFEDVTAAAGVAGHSGWTTGVTFVDVNADGRLDIHVSYSGDYAAPDLRRNQLYVNQGPNDEGVPTFREEAARLGLDDRAMSNQAAFFDYDGDGDLDVYVLNHGVAGYESLEELQAARSSLQVDRLYRNEGGRFVDVSQEAGLIDTNLGFGLGVSVGDVDNDGRPDIFVANDYSGRDYLYLGRAGGRFVEVGRESMGHMSFSSMGSDLADLDGDGWLDLVVLDMAMDSHYDRVMSVTGKRGRPFAEMVEAGEHYQYPVNALHWNRGVGPGEVPVFSEIAYLAGVARTDWGWAPLFADLDNDGRADLITTSGIPADQVHRDFKLFRFMRVEEVTEAEGRVTPGLVEELLQMQPHRHVPNHVFRNEGDRTFSDRSEEWGLGQASYSHGAAYADLDRDGDLDLVVNNLNAEAFIYRNETQPGGDDAHWLRVRFRGPDGNPFGVGARIRLKAGNHQQVQELQLARGYLSSVEPQLHFGLGSDARVDTLEVVWPDGSYEIRTAVAADRALVLDHALATPRPPGSPRSPDRASVVRFDEAGAAIRPPARHVARLSAVDSTLLPYPSRRDEVAVAVGDLDGDGRDDFVFGGSGGEPPRVYLQRDDGAFRGAAPFGPPRGEGDGTVAGAIFDLDGDGREDVWLVEGPTVQPGPAGLHHRAYLNLGEGRFRAAPEAAPDLPDAGVVLAPGDYDGDGDLDLFVGDRTVPGTGRTSGSHLLRNDGGILRDVTSTAAPGLSDLHTVTDALWTDVDGNGTSDLVVAGEWVPITVFSYDGQSLTEATRRAGLAELTGWWQSLVAADFDRDGDPDLIAGNAGLNLPYRPGADAPFALYVSDFDGDGDREAVPAYHQDARLYPWFDRDRLARDVPALTDRYPAHHNYGLATLGEILGTAALADAERFNVTTLATTYLENQGDGRFHARPLPMDAQLSPVTGLVAGDFDGDALPDVVLAGNMEELHTGISRSDAGIGLLLRGDGSGGFRAVAPDASGLVLEGRVRRLAALSQGRGLPPALLAAVAGDRARLLRINRPPGRSR